MMGETWWKGMRVIRSKEAACFRRMTGQETGKQRKALSAPSYESYGFFFGGGGGCMSNMFPAFLDESQQHEKQ